MELGGSTSTLSSSDHAVFLDSELVSAATTSSSIALTIALVELCGIESITTLENFVEFRWRNLWQSTIYRSFSNLDGNLDEFRAWCPASKLIQIPVQI